MAAVDPDHASQDAYLRIFDWIFARLDKWNEEGISIDRIGISVYQPLLEKFCKALGFEYAGINPAGGKIYETTMEKLSENKLYRKRRCL